MYIYPDSNNRVILDHTRTNYTQQAQTAGNTDSSLSSNGAVEKGCCTALIDMIQGWFNALWELVSSCFKGQEASVTNGQPVQTVVSSAPRLPFEQPNPVVISVSSRPNPYAAQQKMVNQAIEQTVKELVGAYEQQNPGCDKTKLHTYLDFSFEKKNPLVSKSWFLEINEASKEFVQFQAEAGELDQFVLHIEVGILANAEGNRWKIYKLTRDISYAASTDLLIKEATPMQGTLNRGDLQFFSRDSHPQAINNFLEKVQRNPVL